MGEAHKGNVLETCRTSRVENGSPLLRMVQQTRLVQRAFLMFLLCATIHLAHASTPTRRIVNVQNQTYLSTCAAIPPYLEFSMTGLSSPTSPPDCCHTDCAPLAPNASALSNWIALVSRGNCSFLQKIINAQNAGAAAVMVYNNEGDGIVRMGASADTSLSVKVPSVFVGASTGDEFKTKMVNHSSGLIEIKLLQCQMDPTAYERAMHETSKYVMLLGAIFMGFLAMLLGSWLRQHFSDFRYVHGPAPSPLAPAFVVSFPQRHGRANEDKDCCICLDELGEGELIRMLPCGHEYHTPCIDRWLTTQQHQCPICKRDITQANAAAARGMQAPPPEPSALSTWLSDHLPSCCKRSSSAAEDFIQRPVELQPLAAISQDDADQSDVELQPLANHNQDVDADPNDAEHPEDRSPSYVSTSGINV